MKIKEENQNNKLSKNKNLTFIKEIAKYFMDFLETDFHKRRNPKRSIKLQNEDNLLIGLNLNKYPSFNSLIWKAVNHSFDKNIIKGIKKGVYKTNIPKNLLDLIKIQIDKISDKQINIIIKDSAEDIKKTATLYKDDYDKALSSSLEKISIILRKDLVLPFVKSLEKPLSNLNLGDENTIYLMEEELTDVLLKFIKDKIVETLRLAISKERVDIPKQLKSVFNLKDIKKNILEFFDSFKVTDLFAEIFELDRNKNILDKQEFYLYFCDITFNRAKYPVFYIPFSLKKEENGFAVDFDAQVYINKKALEYIVQEYSKEKNKKGNLKLITERIIYLAQHKDDLKDVLQSIVNEIVNFFELDEDVDITKSDSQIAKSLLVRLSNSCYIGLFDKSDEALVNDYEDILQLLLSGDSILASVFNRLIEDFIYKDPEFFGEEIYEEWDGLDTSDKLVFNTPIPLNSEQRQILSAINKKSCNYITVEGPPGTGKSHTITAIVFDAILNNKSVLVLSDKKEALDVVEDKISETMNKVRHDKNFQNPILRLGKTGSTYSQILSTTAIENIKTHYHAVKKEHSSIERDIEKNSNTLKEDLEAEILAYSEIDIEEIFELFNLEEKFYKQSDIIFDINEVLEHDGSPVELEELRSVLTNFKDKITNQEYTKLIYENFNFNFDTFKNLLEFENFIKTIVTILDNIKEIKNVFNEKIKDNLVFKEFADKDLGVLQKFIADYRELKHWFLGYSFKKKKIEKLDNVFKQNFYHSKIDEPHKQIEKLESFLEIFVLANKLRNKLPEKIDFDYFYIIYKALLDKNFDNLLNGFVELNEDIKYLKENLNKYPKTLKKISFSLLRFKDYYDNSLIDIDDLEFNKFIRYASLKQKVIKEFKNIPILNYVIQKKNIENLVTTQMTYIMDKRVVGFYDNNRATAKTLRNIIKSKQRFPKKEFVKLKEAFPCILAGIRDYAEYIPLEPDMFDLVIIDEASQVSIAQAFPALLRAKKVLILGDKKQFSNIKAAQARTETNREYLNNIENVFKENISKESDKLVKLKKFNIKTSILEFFEFITNYNAQLLKHFRGYKETISYSNKYFYQDSLQVMKIRGKKIDDVLKFDYIKHDNKQEVIANTNRLEIDFIISELKKLKEQESNLSIGIITPHTNQQKIMMEEISKLPERDYFFEKMKLKIMTFDTCQGEERDIVYYSMVATEDQDHLWGVFIKDLSNVDLEEDGKIKAQRLNVGFSRAKECMHFVLSKPLDKYSGSIGEALRHYHYVLEEAKKEKDIKETDEKSKMEPEVMNWFYQTNFWKNNKDDIEFIPQFKIGKYLKQLDKTYNHPDYVIDFLLVYKDEKINEHKIIIEYDGFQEHFQNIDEVNEFNYKHYYSNEDVYRQKVLESYGYKFLRINKFNIGQNPIATLDKRIGDLIKDNFSGNHLLTNIQKTIKGLQEGEMKECPKCKEVKSLNDFKDKSLVTGYGRFCNNCKGVFPIKVYKDKKTVIQQDIKSGQICPSCGSSMISRSGRYGKFYGCSRFPYCRGTRPH